jgi:hypothetical protein
MKIRFTLLLSTFTSLACTVLAQDQLPAHFGATCTSLHPAGSRLVVTTINERNIIAQAVGLPIRHRGLLRDFRLVYNTASDALQVVDTNGSPIVDVVHFGGGAAISGTNSAERLTFMFFPGQTNQFGSETNLFGTALITEHLVSNPASNGLDHTVIRGRLQFMLTGSNVLGMTNTAAAAASSSAALRNTNSLVAAPAGPGTNAMTVAPAPAASPGFVTGGAEDPTARICMGIFFAIRPVNESGAVTNGLPGPVSATVPVAPTNSIPGVSTGGAAMTTNALPNFPVSSTPEVPTNSIPGLPNVPNIGNTTNATSLGTETNGLPPVPPGP